MRSFRFVIPERCVVKTGGPRLYGEGWRGGFMSVASQLSYMMLYNNVTLQTLIRKHSSV